MYTEIKNMKNETYEEFVEKFKPKKTTDDCITPPLIYETVKSWACKEYGIDPERTVRPFWPGADYRTFNYPDGCVILDNPPFSILTQICEFYLNRGIPFFLFAPALTAFSGKKIFYEMNHILCGGSIIYENGAKVNTGFVTSFGGDVVAQTAPEFGRMIDEATRKLKSEQVKETLKYEYPDHIVTAAMIKKFSKYGIDFKVRRDECILIDRLESQRRYKKNIFGGGLLLSSAKAAEKAAAEKAAAEKAAAIRWELSDAEKEKIKQLDER